MRMSFEVWEEDEGAGLLLSKDLKTAPKPNDFVVDLENEKVEGQRGRSLKKTISLLSPPVRLNFPG